MDNLNDELDKTTGDKLLSALDGMEWAETSEIVKKLNDVPGFWDNVATIEAIRDDWKKRFVRRKIKQIRVKGFPLFASVEKINEEGETVRVYKREDAFVPEDFRKAATYHGETTIYHGKMAQHYAEGYEEATGEKMALPFDPKCFVD